MNETTLAASVKHDPTATVSDLLEIRFKETPQHELFSVPRKDGGWDHVTTSDFRARVITLAKGFVAAGLKPGDLIVEIDGRAITSPEELIVAVRSHDVGDSVVLKYIRAGKQYEVTLILTVGK